MSDHNDDTEEYSDDDLHSYEVAIRAWGPDHDPGEADYEHYTVDAADEEEAKELAYEEASSGIDQLIESRMTGEVVEVHDLGPADEDLIADGGEVQQTGDQRDGFQREIVVEPANNTAGFGVTRVDNPGPHETRYRVDQLWGDGRAEPLYVGDEAEVMELIEALTRAVKADV